MVSTGEAGSTVWPMKEVNAVCTTSAQTGKSGSCQNFPSEHPFYQMGRTTHIQNPQQVKEGVIN